MTRSEIILNYEETEENWQWHHYTTRRDLLYRMLSNEDIQELIDLMVVYYHSNKTEIASFILAYISIFTDGEQLRANYETLIENHIFDFPEIYAHGNEDTVGAFIIAYDTILATGDTSFPTDSFLKCLVFMPNALSMTFLLKLDVAFKNGETKIPMYASPLDYTYEGGWCIENGAIRLLYSKEIEVLKPDFKWKYSKEIQEQSKRCPSCGDKLIDMYYKDSRFTTCHICACYTTLYRNHKGDYYVLEKGGEAFQKKHGDEAFKEHHKILIKDKTNLTSYITSNEFITTLSQINGLPTFVGGDAHYPKCPKCHKTMKFIGQINAEDIKPSGEGMYHFFQCDDCTTVASTYDQS